MNDIIKLLNLEDPDVIISSINVQDGFALRLILKQCRWKCTNPACAHEENENFAFISPGRRSTNLTDILILESFKDLNLSAASMPIVSERIANRKIKI